MDDVRGARGRRVRRHGETRPRIPPTTAAGPAGQLRPPLFGGDPGGTAQVAHCAACVFGQVGAHERNSLSVTARQRINRLGVQARLTGCRTIFNNAALVYFFCRLLVAPSGRGLETSIRAELPSRQPAPRYAYVLAFGFDVNVDAGRIASHSRRIFYPVADMVGRFHAHGETRHDQDGIR